MLIPILIKTSKETDYEIVSNYSKQDGNIEKDNKVTSVITIEDIIDKDRNYIEKNYDKDITLNDLAEKFAVSVAYLSKAFRIQTGVSFSRYLINKRIEQAKKLLVGTDIPISDISKSIGYDDIQYFYRIFKREVKCTPVNFRRRVRN